MNAEILRNVSSQYAYIAHYTHAAKAKAWVYNIISRGRNAAKHGKRFVSMPCKKELVREAKSMLSELGYSVSVSHGLLRTTVTIKW